MIDYDNTRTPGRAAQIVRGVSRFLVERGESCLTEFTFKTGRRVDVIALDRKGRIAVVEVKSSVADFRSDRKWSEYLEYCDLFFFAVDADFPQEILPPDCGIILADAYGAAIIRDSSASTLNAARRKAVTLRFARTSAGRLLGYTDPDWIRGYL
jgi:hypothetical protein